MFEKGKIEIQVSKTDFRPGGQIAGKVTLTMKKPVKAKEVSISLIGEQTTTSGGGFSGKEPSKTTQRIYDFKNRLDGEKEYSGQQAYDFSIKVPADILSRQAQMPQASGALGQGIKIAQAFTGMGAWSSWYLLAKLDVSGGLDINKKLQIVIG